MFLRLQTDAQGRIKWTDVHLERAAERRIEATTCEHTVGCPVLLLVHGDRDAPVRRPHAVGHWLRCGNESPLRIEVPI
jgi:hypothetical protein